MNKGSIGRKKVIVIGNGAVGSSYAFTLVNSNIVREIGILDINKERSQGDVLDLEDALAYTHPKDIFVADYSDCKDADLVVITAGAPQREGETRLDLVTKNMRIMKSIITSLMASGFKGIILVASNPVDIMAYAAQKFSKLPYNRVFGSGTTLDSARFRREISNLIDVDSRNVHGYIMGEHGDTEFPVWSKTTVAGQSIFDWVEKHDEKIDQEKLANIGTKVKNKAYDIISRKGATYYGIAVALHRITKAIFGNEKSVLPLSVYVDGKYGLKDVYIGIPAVVDKEGIVDVLELDLNEIETNKLKLSYDTINKVMRKALEEVESE